MLRFTHKPDFTSAELCIREFWSLLEKLAKAQNSAIAINFPSKMWLKTQLNHWHKKPFVQATGLVNDHITNCFRHTECRQLAQL